MAFGIQQITVTILIIWFFIFVAGKLQQNRIKKKLFHRIKTELSTKLETNPDLSLDTFYDWVFSGWDDLVRKNAWFVLNKNELWPVAANPKRLKKQMNLTPEWLGAYLQIRGTQLQMSESQQEDINHIINTTPAHHRRAIQDD